MTDKMNYYLYEAKDKDQGCPVKYIFFKSKEYEFTFEGYIKYSYYSNRQVGEYKNSIPKKSCKALETHEYIAYRLLGYLE